MLLGRVDVRIVVDGVHLVLLVVDFSGLSNPLCALGGTQRDAHFGELGVLGALEVGLGHWGVGVALLTRK